MQTENGHRAVIELRHHKAHAPRYSVRLPVLNCRKLSQDEAYFYLGDGPDSIRIRFHDYDEIYKRPGLYEQIFYERLKCESPRRMAHWLETSVLESGGSLSALRVLDLGAGNGMVGQALAQVGVARLVGVDILSEAKEATDRDRPGLYDSYYIGDLTIKDSPLIQEVSQWRFDCLTSVAALGFGDIPTQAFINAYNLVDEGGWICFNIKETFLSEKDDTGFSILVRQILLSQRLELHRLVRYRHRYSIDGEPLFYYGIVGRKQGGPLPDCDV
ncbi:MAG TPA: class I SAM-dependent methyltransferase [Fimbriimonadaceae bacterium]|nr:class I SAM-dependent methyltransferase [Fimbriimonadaceae bacterium]